MCHEKKGVEETPPHLALPRSLVLKRARVNAPQCHLYIPVHPIEYGLVKNNYARGQNGRPAPSEWAPITPQNMVFPLQMVFASDVTITSGTWHRES